MLVLKLYILYTEYLIVLVTISTSVNNTMYNHKPYLVIITDTHIYPRSGLNNLINLIEMKFFTTILFTFFMSHPQFIIKL